MTNYTDKFEELDLSLHGVRLPNFEITDAQKRDVKISEDSDNFTFLKALCEQGIRDRKLKGKVYEERMDYELETLNDLGFIDYILLVWDVTNFL